VLRAGRGRNQVMTPPIDPFSALMMAARFAAGFGAAGFLSREARRARHTCEVVGYGGVCCRFVVIALYARIAISILNSFAILAVMWLQPLGGTENPDQAVSRPGLS